MTDDANTAAAEPRPARGVVVARWVELSALFLLIPAMFWWTRLNPGVAADALARVGITGRMAQAIAGGRLMIPTLLLFALLCLIWLIVDRRFPNRRLWNFRAGMRDVPRILALSSTQRATTTPRAGRGSAAAVFASSVTLGDSGE